MIQVAHKPRVWFILNETCKFLFACGCEKLPTEESLPLISGPLNNTLHDTVIEMKRMLCTAASICAIDLLQNTVGLRILYW